MKKLYFLVVVLFVVGSVNGQIIIFPDANFKAKLLEANTTNSIAKNLSGVSVKIDTNNDGEIQFSETQPIGYLNVAFSTITNLSGIQYFSGLKELECQGNELTSLNITNNLFLESLNCSGNQFVNLDISNHPNLNSLIVAPNSYLTNLTVKYIPNLTTLNLADLENLVNLDCSYNALTTLDLSGLINLEVISCGENELSSLNIGSLSNINSLDCSYNSITMLDLASVISIEYVAADYNQITSLSFEGFENLKVLSLSSNALQTLNVEGCSALYDLSIGWNPIETINLSSCTALDTFSCLYSQITSLDFSGLTQLKNVYCQNNQLTSINVNGCTSLETLWAENNELTSIDVSTATALQLMDLKQNNLESLFIKNGLDTGVMLEDNPGLRYICTSEDLIYQFEGVVGQITTPLWFGVVINSYCTFTPGGEFYIIKGSNDFDIDNNGCDDSDPIFPNLKFTITDGAVSGSMICDSEGLYTIPVQAGTHTISPNFENPIFFNVSPSTISVTFPETTSPFTQNFCITPNGLHPDLEVVIVPTDAARPGFDAHYKIIIKNKGNIQQSGSVNFTYNDAVLDYVIANPVFTTQAEGSLTWEFTNLEPFETREINVTLNVNSPMETPAVNGDDVLTYTATITSDQVDDLPLDNIFTLPQIVVNSFDPNDKTCLEGTSITPAMIGKYVHYMIRFENTGTFPAENIVVKDMIDVTKFDVSSLVALNGSHSFVTRIIENKVEFIFANINLPFDDANNDGYVVFKIKTLPTLALGDSFSNSASIYFDYNFPIITEPAVTTFAQLGTEDFNFNSYFTLYPNPTNGILNITSKQDVELQSISIYNVLGQMVVAVPNAKGISNVDVSSLSTGNYFIKVISDKGTSNTKFIKN